MAVSALAVGEVRTTGSDLSGGFFVVGSGGTDYSQSDTPHANGTNLTVDATTNTNVAPDAYAVVAGDVGNYVNISSGAGFTPGGYQITGTNAGKWVLDRSPGTVNTSGGTWALGGALATPGKALSFATGSNLIWVKSGTYTVSSGGQVYSYSGSSGTNIAPTRLMGYAATRGDIFLRADGVYVNNASRPVFQQSTTNGMTTLATATNFFNVENIIFDGGNLTNSSGSSLSGVDCIVHNCLYRNHKFNTCQVGLSGLIFRCEYTGNSGGSGVYCLGASSGCIVLFNNFHGNSSQGCTYGTSVTFVGNKFVGFSGANVRAINCTNFIDSAILFNTFDSGAAQGLFVSTSGMFSGAVLGNVITGFATGFQGAASGVNAVPSEPFWDGNGYFGNTNNRVNMDNNVGNQRSTGPYTNQFDQVATATPYVNSAGGNYNLNANANAGLLMRSLQNLFQLPGDTTNISYFDLGAFHHQDTGSGATVRKCLVASAP